MKTWFRILIYSAIVIIANWTLSIWVNYFSDYCKWIEPYSKACIRLLPNWFFLIFFVVLWLFAIMVVIEIFFPIKIDKFDEKLKKTTDFIEDIWKSIIKEHKSAHELTAEIHEAASKAMQNGNIKDAKDILKMKKQV